MILAVNVTNVPNFVNRFCLGFGLFIVLLTFRILQVQILTLKCEKRSEGCLSVLPLLSHKLHKRRARVIHFTIFLIRMLARSFAKRGLSLQRFGFVGRSVSAEVPKPPSSPSQAPREEWRMYEEPRKERNEKEESKDQNEGILDRMRNWFTFERMINLMIASYVLEFIADLLPPPSQPKMVNSAGEDSK